MREEAAQMGTYLNPGNLGFKEIIAGEYVDKTGLIILINRTIGTKQKLTCISRPRRFGKSYAAQMLSAYYGKNCDSAALFKDYEISGDPSYLKHLNRYDVIYVDMTYLKPFTDGYRALASYLTAKLTEELKAEYPSLEVSNELPATMISAAELTGNRFVMIIDEWDAPIREEPAIEKEYLEFLRTLFKGCQTVPRIFAAVYMTGILPIKKDGSQFAISDFEEYTMLDPAEFARYVGLTESEVKRICRGFHADFDKMKLWYDGYHLEGVGSVYNPYSVIKAARSNTFRSYWTQTSAAESLMGYLGRDEKGLGKTIAELIGGIEVEVDTNGFANDLITFRDKDDVLTLLVHLGYLAYDEERQTVSIPNKDACPGRSVRENEIHSAILGALNSLASEKADILRRDSNLLQNISSMQTEISSISQTILNLQDQLAHCITHLEMNEEDESLANEAHFLSSRLTEMQNKKREINEKKPAWSMKKASWQICWISYVLAK